MHSIGRKQRLEITSTNHWVVSVSSPDSWRKQKQSNLPHSHQSTERNYPNIKTSQYYNAISQYFNITIQYINITISKVVKLPSVTTAKREKLPRKIVGPTFLCRLMRQRNTGMMFSASRVQSSNFGWKFDRVDFIRIGDSSDSIHIRDTYNAHQSRQ